MESGVNGWSRWFKVKLRVSLTKESTRTEYSEFVILI